MASLKRWKIRQPRWFRFDLDAIEDLLDHDNGTPMRIPCPAPPRLSRPFNVSWTDACRETGRDAFSGMAGFSARTRVLWYYKFSQEHVDQLPIHILEAVAEILNLGMMAPCLKGEAALAFCDNMSWVTSLQYAKPSDPRLRTLLILRQELADQFELQVHSAYVNTKRNIVADEASRGNIEAALAHLKERGWDLATIKVVDLNQHPEEAPADLEQLLKHMVEATVDRRMARDKAERASPPPQPAGRK